jgi:glycosyltransferase involved in cell wall biosynthesis
MPRVLIISYHFPPAGGPAVQRVMGMVRHLPAFGWDPVVLTVRDGTYMNRDNAALADVPPGVPVYRAATIEPYAVYNRLTGRSATEPLPLGHTGTSTPGIVGRIAQVVRANLFIPDARVGWVPFATRMARKIVREQNIDAIITSGPPQSTHLVGRNLARRTGLPWVADFRDPWTEIYYNKDLPRLSLARALDRHLERSCLRSADEIVVVNKYVRDLLGLSADEVNEISNGYEEADFREPVEPDPDFSLVYTGNLIASLGVTSTLFRVLGELATNPDFRAALRLVLVGRVHERAVDELAQYGLDDCVELKGFVPHAEAVDTLRRATVPLFIGPGDILGAKVFEYIATGRPLLALAPPGLEVDLLLRDAGRDGTIAHEDAEGIRERLIWLYERWRSSDLPVQPPMTGVEHLSRHARTEAIASVLNRSCRRAQEQ